MATMFFNRFMLYCYYSYVNFGAISIIDLINDTRIFFRKMHVLFSFIFFILLIPLFFNFLKDFSMVLIKSIYAEREFKTNLKQK